MKKKHIRGTLVPSNVSAVTEETRRCIYHAVTRNSLGGIANGSKLGRGIIDINSTTRTATGSRADALAFVSALHNVIQTEGVAELGLKGTLIIVIDTDTEPVLFQVKVKKGEITYRQGSVYWGAETTF